MNGFFLSPKPLRKTGKDQSVRTHQPLRNDPSENLVNGGVYKIRSDLMAHIVSPRHIIGILQYPSISLRLDGFERTLRWFTENSVGKNTQSPILPKDNASLTSMFYCVLSVSKGSIVSHCHFWQTRNNPK